MFLLHISICRRRLPEAQKKERYSVDFTFALCPLPGLLQALFSRSWSPGSTWSALGAWSKTTWVGCRVCNYTHVIGAASQIPPPRSACATGSPTQDSVSHWQSCSSGYPSAWHCRCCMPCASCLSYASMTPPCKVPGGTATPCHAWSYESSAATACNIHDGSGLLACAAPRSAYSACRTPSRELPLRKPCPCSRNWEATSTCTRSPLDATSTTMATWRACASR